MIRHVRSRYLAINLDSDNFLEEDDLKKAVWDTVLRLFGEYGASKAGLFLINYDKEKRRAVLRCSHKALPIVHASIAAVTEVNGYPVALHVSRISGTLKALNRKRGN